MVTKGVMIVRTLILALSVVIFAFSGAQAADVYTYIHGTGNYREVIIEGEVQKGDYDDFLRIIEENQGEVSSVRLFTAGGDFYESMKIGRVLRKLELGSSVPNIDEDGRPVCEGLVTPKSDQNCTCLSSCFFIHIGSVHRSGLFLGVHRPYFDPQLFGQMSREQAKNAFDLLQISAREYLNEMEVPEHIQETVLGTPSDKITILDENTVRTHFLAQIPYIYEWIRGRCGILGPLEQARYEVLVEKLKSRIISETELSELDEIHSIMDQETDCEIVETKKTRRDAYLSFFGNVPSDHGSTVFATWPDAVSFLGKPFEKLLTDGFVEQEPFLGSHSMERSATASEPFVQVYDVAADSARTVGSLSVFSSSNPSSAYVQNVRAALTNAWGSPSSESENGVLHWDFETAVASLALRGPFADGTALILKLEAKN